MRTRLLEHTGALGLYCDDSCCGLRIAASIKDGALVIRTERHGETHTLTLPLDKLVQLDLVSRQQS